ncbi:MAG: FTR1 family protein, partial [Hyphomicrobiales bacterium]|nr:FTR1 family protein [Hyphomicrobiales bacterium]
AAILALAVCMLAWHNIWMASHGRELAAQARQLGQDVRSGARSGIALAIVIAVAVMREGSEVVLFLYGLAASGGTTVRDVLLGSILGLAAGAVLSILTYFGLVAIPARRLFGATTALITLLAAGLAAQSANFLQQAGVVSALSQTAWDTSGILSDTSILGRVLHTLVGYSDQPSVLQVVVYCATLATIFALSKAVTSRALARRTTAAAPQRG